jgi:outer membrane protein TolC
MHPIIERIGGGRARIVLGLGITCAVVLVVDVAAAESGSKRDCRDQAADGPAMTIRQKNVACPPSRVGRPRPEARRVKSPEDLPGATAEDLLARVRTLNPELAAAALDREAAVAKIYPAGALDDPTVNLTRDQGFRQTMVTVSQEFPLWGKRELRREVAEANASAARGKEGSVKSELEEQLKMVFAQYYQAEQAILLTRNIRGVLHDVVQSARVRYAQGLGNQSDAIRAELEQTRVDPELASLERDEQAAKAKINALIGRPADAALAAAKLLRRVPSASALAFEGLLARAREGNPTLVTARSEIAAAEGERALVDKSWYPDVTVTAGITDLPDMSPRLTAGVGVKVPLQWGVREAREHETTAKKGAAQLRFDAALLKIGTDLQTALADLARAQRNADVFERTLTAQSEAAYHAALVSYQQGRAELAPVLEAARQRLQIGIELLRARSEAQAALATIERLIGGDL